MSSGECLLPASLNKRLNFICDGQSVLETKIIKRGEPLNKQVIFAPRVQVVAVCPLDHLGGSVPFWLPVSATAFCRQGSAGKIRIQRPIRKTAVAASAVRQTSLLTDGIHVKIYSVIFAIAGLVVMALFRLDFLLVGLGL